MRNASRCLLHVGNELHFHSSRASGAGGVFLLYASPPVNAPGQGIATTPSEEKSMSHSKMLTTRRRKGAAKKKMLRTEKAARKAVKDAAKPAPAAT